MLVIDNYTAHPALHGLTNVKLVFLPFNTAAKTQLIDPGIILCLKAHYRKNLAEMCLLAFEGKREFKIDVLEAVKLLDQAWISVSEMSIRNCFTKLRFASTSEENQETAIELKNTAEEIRGRLQTAGLVPEDVSLIEYVEGDANLVMQKTITESSIINDLTASKVPADEEKDNDENCLDEPEPTPFMTVEALQT